MLIWISLCYSSLYLFRIKLVNVVLVFVVAFVIIVCLIDGGWRRGSFLFSSSHDDDGCDIPRFDLLKLTNDLFQRLVRLRYCVKYLPSLLSIFRSFSFTTKCSLYVDFSHLFNTFPLFSLPAIITTTTMQSDLVRLFSRKNLMRIAGSVDFLVSKVTRQWQPVWYIKVEDLGVDVMVVWVNFWK